MTGRVLICLLLCASSPAAQDWPQLLGPARDGVAAVPEGVKLAEPRLLWERELGSGFAGPVVAGGRVIVAHRRDDELVVDAVDAVSGVLLWSCKRATDYVDSFGFDDGPRGVPAVADGRVFVHGADGIVDAIDLETGDRLWQVDTVSDYESPQGFFGRACSPLVMGDRVIITPGGACDGKPAGVVALEAKSGKPLWQSVKDEAGYASPVAVGEDRLLCWMRNEVWLLNAADGGIVSHRPLRAGMEASVNAAQPVLLDGDRVAISAGYGVGLHVLRLPDLEPLWSQQNLLDCHYSSPVREGERLFGFDGRQETGQTLRCIDLAKREVVWESGRVPGGMLIRAGGYLLVVTEQGELWVVPTKAAQFDPAHTVQILRSGHRAHLAFAGGVLFARDGHQLVAVRVFE